MCFTAPPAVSLPLPVPALGNLGVSSSFPVSQHPFKAPWLVAACFLSFAELLCLRALCILAAFLGVASSLSSTDDPSSPSVQWCCSSILHPRDASSVPLLCFPGCGQNPALQKLGTLCHLMEGLGMCHSRAWLELLGWPVLYTWLSLNI